MRWLSALIFVLGSTVAHAGDGKFFVPDNLKWKEECSGSCHIAYPPQLLTADDWQRMMGGLDKHFGANAALGQDSKEILDFLQLNAGKGGRFSAASLRISDTPWFTHEHRGILRAAWSDPAVKSRSNCMACHLNVEHWYTTLFFVLGNTMAQADGGRYSLPDNPKLKAKCGSCHIAYPPQLLTTSDWQKLMEGLGKHFDANVALDQQDSNELLDFLQNNAAKGGKFNAPSLRISDTPWFFLEHREISNNTWLDPAVKSRSNCAACHVDGEQGDWSERGIKMPGGNVGYEGQPGRGG